MLLQIQSVIYGNKKDSLLKAIAAIKQAVRTFQRANGELEVRLIYGEASPNKIFRDEDVKELTKSLDGVMDFEYKIFGFNSGTAKGHNIMAAGSQADYIMIMNPDIILEPRCILRLLEPFAKDDRVGMTEARQTPLEHAKEYDISTGETEWASTACTIFRTAVFNEVGGFDEKTFFLYCDDLDFSWRIRLNGYKILYIPSAIAYHAKNLALDGSWQPTNAEVYYSAEAAILLAYKWSNRKRAEYLCSIFEKYGGEEEKRAVSEFNKRMSENLLPPQIDEDHKIAKFLGDDYCEMRFRFKN